MTIPSTLFPYINMMIFIFLFIMLVWGYFKGFLLQIFSILIFIAVVFVSWMIAPALAKALPLMQANEQFNILPIIGPMFQQSINTILWFIIIVFGLMVTSFFFRPVLKGIGKLPIIKIVNRILGLVLAGIKAVVILIIVTLILNAGIFTNGKDVVNQSVLSQVQPVSTFVVQAISAKFDPSGVMAKIMTGQEFSVEDTIVLNAWLKSKNIPDDVIPVLSKVLRLKSVNATEMGVLLSWMRENGISEADITQFMENFK